MTDQFILPIPQAFLSDPETAEWARAVTLLLDDLTRQDGVVATVDSTETTVLTHAEKLDQITVTQAVDLDAIESDTASNTSALASLQDSLPAYSISNDGTDRTFNADAAAGTITNPPTQAEVENIRDAVLELGDVVATVIRDLGNKSILG